MDISVDQAYGGLVQEDWLRAAVERALGVACPNREACQVSLAVTSDETIRDLNRDYRGLDEVTDVLAFSASFSGHWEGEPDQPNSHGPDMPDFVFPPGEAAPLGEVVIAYPQAKRQAEQRGVALGDELALLTVHGVLHLAGHDHAEPEEQDAMQAKERAALDALPAPVSDRTRDR